MAHEIHAQLSTVLAIRHILQGVPVIGLSKTKLYRCELATLIYYGPRERILFKLSSNHSTG